MNNEEKILSLLQSISYRLENLEKSMKELEIDLEEVKDVQTDHGGYVFSIYNGVRALKRYNRQQDSRLLAIKANTFKDSEHIKTEINNLKMRIEKLEQKKAE